MSWFATVHRVSGERASWVAYVDADDEVYVWSPDLGRFARSEGLTADLDWAQNLTYVPISPERARHLCDEGVVGRIQGSATDWVRDELESAPSVALDAVLPSGASVPGNAETPRPASQPPGRAASADEGLLRC